MKLTVPGFCSRSSSSAAAVASPKASNKSKSARRSSKDGKSGGAGGGRSFSSTATASSHECASTVTTSRTVLLPPSSPPRAGTGAGTTTASRKPPAAVTREELEMALRQMVSSEEELAEMLAEADAGLVVSEELVVDADVGGGEDCDLREAFAVFDANGDGKISAEELCVALASLGDDRCSVEDCRRMISGVDVDGDGFVCFDEFLCLMMHGL